MSCLAIDENCSNQVNGVAGVGCVGCNTGFYLSSDIDCTAVDVNCAVEVNSHLGVGCTTCNAGYYPSDLINCALCTELPNCLDCDTTSGECTYKSLTSDVTLGWSHVLS